MGVSESLELRFEHPPDDALFVAVKQISSVISLTSSLSTLSSSPSSFSSTQLTSLTHFASAALLAGDMTTWNGPARHLTQIFFSSFPLLALRLSAILSDLGWAGWNLVIAPQVGKVIVPLLKTAPGGEEAALGLVSHLVKKGLLTDVPESARSEVAEWARERLDVEGGTWSLEREVDVSTRPSISLYSPAEIPRLIIGPKSFFDIFSRHLASSGQPRSVDCQHHPTRLRHLHDEGSGEERLRLEIYQCRVGAVGLLCNFGTRS